MKRIIGKNVFLTGGSSGIGRATAELLASQGYKVFAASRNPSNDVRSFPGGGGIYPVKLDVRDQLSVETSTKAVFAQADIGIVIHCAGIGIACPGESFRADAVADLMETNFTGVLRVNSQILPHLRQRGGGLCIIIGSIAGMFPIPFQSHYCSSKAALDLYAAALRMELREHSVNVCLIMPGDTNTSFTQARTYEIDETSPFYESCLKAVQKMEKDERCGRQPLSVANAILKIIERKNPPRRYIVGLNYKFLAFLGRLLPDRIIEIILAKMYLEG